MRISDWSSDVCSSDLSLERLLKRVRAGRVDSLQEAFALAAGGDGLNRLMQVDLLTQMPNDLLMLTDKMTMASSLECRVPLLNHELVELAARVPAALRIDGRKDRKSTRLNSSQ